MLIDDATLLSGDDTEKYINWGMITKTLQEMDKK